MNIEQLGARAAQTLYAAMSGEEAPPGVHRRPCTLIVRGSTLR